jgi:hypothetical protein
VRLRTKKPKTAKTASEKARASDQLLRFELHHANPAKFKRMLKALFRSPAKPK